MTRFGYVMTTYFAVMLIGGLSFIHIAPKLIWNASASTPIGLYSIDRSPRLDVTDLVAVAKGFGIADAFATGTLEGSDDIARRVMARAGTVFAQVFVEVEELPRALPPRDGPYIKNRFRAALGLKPF